MGYRVKDAKKWPNRKIPYMCTDEMLKDEYKSFRKLIKACMDRWEQFINVDQVYVEFVLRTNEEKYVQISPTGDGSTTSGEIGMPTDRNYSMFRIRTNQLDGFDHRSSIPHELGHVLGLAHEHHRSRPLIENGKLKAESGDEELTKDPTKARLYWLGNPMRSKEESFADWDQKYVPVGDYDLQSIMHYPSAGGWQWNYEPYQGKKGAAVAIAALNYPSAAQVIAKTWAPSPGDIAAIRELYR
jgi:hypothetical protein